MSFNQPFNQPPSGPPAGHSPWGPPPYRPNPRIDPWAATRVGPIPTSPGQHPAFAPHPAGPQPYAAHPYLASQAPRRNSQRMWVAFAASLAVVVIAVCTGLAVIAGRASRTAENTSASGESGLASSVAPTTVPPAVVEVSALPGLLLDAATVNSLEGAIAMQAQPDPKANVPYTGEINHPECAGLAHPATRMALDGSGWVAMQAQYLREPGDEWNHAVTQTVISYANAEGASAFAAKQAENWAKCTGKSLTMTTKTASVTWSVGPANSRDGVLTALLTQEGAGGWACQRALMVRSNIVIDTRTCGDNVVDQAATIARKIADRITTT
jgi:serine/threonine kinase PknH